MAISNSLTALRSRLNPNTAGPPNKPDLLAIFDALSGYESGASGGYVAAAGDRATIDGKTMVKMTATGSALAVGQVVLLDNDANTATLLSTSNDAANRLVGVVAEAAAQNALAFIQVVGQCLIQVAASCAAHVPLNTTGTAGQVDDDATSTTFVIQNMFLNTARGGTAGTASGFINNPRLAAAAI